MKKRVFFGILALITTLGFTGCKDDGPPEPFKLTVSGITGTAITAGSLVRPSDQAVVAVAMNVNGTFTFYNPISDANPMPNNDKPFAAKGSFLVALAKVTDLQTFQPDEVYMYGVNNSPVPVEFKGDVTLAWTGFFKQQQQP
jgi:hypothetical protein